MQNGLKRKGLNLAKLIKRAYYLDQFEEVVVWGPKGWGKSCYAVQVAAEVYGSHEDPDWEAVKDVIVFRPIEFVRKLVEGVEHGIRYKCLIWDDAGVWLNSKDWQKPLLKQFDKLNDVARTFAGGIIYTTPVLGKLVKAVREDEHLLGVKIIKVTGNPYQWYRRKAVVYRHWHLPSFIKGRPRKLFEDEFDALMPDDFFKWYQKKRNQYAGIALKEFVKALIEEYASTLDELDILSSLRTIVRKDPDLSSASAGQGSRKPLFDISHVVLNDEDGDEHGP